MTELEWTSKAGTLDTLVSQDGSEAAVFIEEDTATHMVVRVVETGQRFKLVKQQVQ